jgi:anti-sigma factor RsiW
MELPCSLPPPLTEDQITAALDGEAESSVLHHLDQCPGCRVRFEQARQVEQMLSTRLHPSSQELGDYHLGLIRESSDRIMIERHLDRCAACREEIADLNLFLADEQVAISQAQPESTKSGRLSLAAVHRHLSELIAQLAPGTPSLALRGVATGPIMLEADGTTVFLETQQTHDGLILAGQIVAEDTQRWVGALVMLRQTNDTLMTVLVDDAGQFRCGGIRAGVVAIRITSATGQTLILDGVEI